MSDLPRTFEVRLLASQQVTQAAADHLVGQRFQMNVAGEIEEVEILSTRLDANDGVIVRVESANTRLAEALGKQTISNVSIRPAS